MSSNVVGPENQVDVAPTEQAGNGPIQTDRSATTRRTSTPKLSVLKHEKSSKRAARKNHAKGVGRTKSWGFPASSFEEALPLANAMQQHAPGQQSVRRLTIFHNIGKSPDSSVSRTLVTNSHKYGLTEGSYAAEYIKLTPDGNVATNPDISDRDRMGARFRLAIERIAPFKALYERLQGNKLPSPSIMRDALKEAGFNEAEVAQAVDTFIVNAKFLGLLKTVAGAERFLTLDHAMEGMVATLPASMGGKPPHVPVTAVGAATAPDWSKICFYITPIGQPESADRKHSDLFLGSIVEPAMEELGLEVVRADQIAKPGMITAQVIEYVTKAKLVIADLSHHNPNVFYELALRHASRLPTVQLIRLSDTIPFDLDQFRTIRIDDTTIYDFVPKLEVYRSEVANQARQALADPEAVDNPVSAFAPSIKLH